MKAEKKKNNVIHLKDRVKNGFKKLNPNSLWNSLKSFFSMLLKRVQMVVNNPIIQYIVTVVSWTMFVHALNIVVNSAWLAALPPVQAAIAIISLVLAFIVVAYIAIQLMVTATINMLLFFMEKEKGKEVQA